MARRNRIKVELERSLFRTVAASLVAALSGSAFGAPGDITDLGTLGGISSFGQAVNVNGEVAGYSFTTGNTAIHAFRTANGGFLADLGTLGGTQSHGYALNVDGHVAGSASTPGDLETHAFRHTRTSFNDNSFIMDDLGTLGGNTSEGRGINDSGQVAGWSYLAGDTVQHAFRYTGTPGSAGTMADLGTLGGTNSLGFAINNSSQVAGWSNTAGDAQQHAFRYTGTPGIDGQMVDLGTLGGTNSFAFGINNSGQVAGYSLTAGDAETHAFLYTGTPGSGGVMHDLGSLGGGFSQAFSVNSSGDVVGVSSTGTADRAFLYTGTPGVDGQMINLDAWLDATNPLDGPGWTLQNAFGICDNGFITFVTGVGVHEGEFRAYLLDVTALVPEPMNLSMLALAGLILRRRR